MGVNNAKSWSIRSMFGEEQWVFHHQEADVNISCCVLLHQDKIHIEVTADDTGICQLLMAMYENPSSPPRSQ